MPHRLRSFYLALAGRTNITDQWLLQPGLFREGMGASWWTRKHPDALHWYVLSCNHLPARTRHLFLKLHQRNIQPTPFCSACPSWKELPCTQSHIQCRCDGTQEARIKAHHTLQKAVSADVQKHCKQWKSFPEATLGFLLATLGRATGLALPDIHSAVHSLEPGDGGGSRRPFHGWYP